MTIRQFLHMLGKAQNTGFYPFRILLRIKPTEQGNNAFLRSFHERNDRMRCIMLVSHSGRTGCFIFPQGPQDAAGHLYLAAQDTADHTGGDTAGTKHNRGAMAEIQHSGLHTDIAHAAVYDEGNLCIHILHDVGCGCGTGPA